MTVLYIILGILAYASVAGFWTRRRLCYYEEHSLHTTDPNFTATSIGILWPVTFPALGVMWIWNRYVLRPTPAARKKIAEREAQDRRLRERRQKRADFEAEIRRMKREVEEAMKKVTEEDPLVPLTAAKESLEQEEQLSRIQGHVEQGGYDEYGCYNEPFGDY